MCCCCRFFYLYFSNQWNEMEMYHKTDLWHKRNALLSARTLVHTCTSIWYRFDFKLAKKGNDFSSLRSFCIMLFDLCADSNESLVSEHVQNSYESVKLGIFEKQKQKKFISFLGAVLIIYTFDIISMHSSYLEITKRYCCAMWLLLCCFINGKSKCTTCIVWLVFFVSFCTFRKNKP